MILAPLVSILLLGLPIVAQDASASMDGAASRTLTDTTVDTPSATASDSGADASPTDDSGSATDTGTAFGSAAPATTSKNTKWNETVFLFPNSGNLGYWVQGIENQMMWNTVKEPCYIVLTNTNASVWTGNLTVAQNVNGGVTNYSAVDIGTLPIGKSYQLNMYEEGTGKHLAQSEGFKVKESNSMPGTYVTSSALPTADAGATAASGSGAGASSSGASASASATGKSSAGHVGASVAGALFVVFGTITVI